MKNEFVGWMFALLILPFVNAGCQNTSAGTPGADIEISPAALKTAEWSGFKYREVLDKAKTGDLEAIKQFLNFHRVVDGADAVGHAVSCLELIPVVGDYKYALAVQSCKPNLKLVLKARLVMAQGHTKKTELVKPLEQWAPNVWAAVDGKPLVSSPADSSEVGMTKASDANMFPPRPNTAADSTAKAARASEQSPATVPAPAPGSERAPAPAPAPQPKKGENKPKQ